MRWASTLAHPPNRATVAGLAALHLYHVLLLLPLALGFSDISWLVVGGLSLMVKLCVDLVAVLYLLARLRMGHLIRAFPLAAAILHVEVILAPLAFFAKFRWKGRTYRRGVLSDWAEPPAPQTGTQAQGGPGPAHGRSSLG